MRARELSADEFGAIYQLFHAGTPHRRAMAAMMLVMVSSGARVSEVTSTIRSDYINPDGSIKERFRRRKLKSRSEAYISRPIMAAVKEDLTEWFDFQKRHYGATMRSYAFAIGNLSRQPSRSRFCRDLKIACRQLGINSTGVSSHSFRKTFAMQQLRQWLKECNGNQWAAARKVQRLLEHRSVDTTLAYLAISDDNPEKYLDTLNNWIEYTKQDNNYFPQQHKEQEYNDGQQNNS